MTALKWEDIDLGSETLKVVAGKGGKTARVNLSSTLVEALEQAHAYIQAGALKIYERHGFGLYLMELKGERTPIGICGLVKRDTLDDVDLGFALAHKHRGKGYAREAAAATVACARDTLGLRRVVAIVAPDNANSVRLLGGLGFSFEREMDYPDGSKVHLLALAT